MKPIEKTSDDLFQKLRSRFSPISMGDENADETSNPTEARIFNFMYKDNENEIGYVSISVINNRSFKVYYGTDLVEKVENKTGWYNFLKELRMFAKRNLMSFDARDLAKNQLEPRDFKFISQQDGTYKEHEVTVSESVMFGSRRKSYQTMENVKMIVNHRKSIDETIPGARSRYIESIYLERADGERYKFPYTYLTGARAMARHVNEGGNPYDDMGKHIINMIGEMRHLSKFARRTKKHAMEDENASNIRNSVVERFHNMKKQLGAMSVKEGYDRFVEGFKADEALVEDDTVQQIKERFTQQVFDTQLEDTLPAVIKALKEAEMRQVAEKTMDKSIASLIKGPLVLRKDDAADQMFLNTKFTDGAGLLGFILSDIASRAIGDNADEIANFASDAAERIQDKDYDQNDKQTAMRLAKKYMDDVRKALTDREYKDAVRRDPKSVYGNMKKREGGFHEAEQYEAWANDLVPENGVNEVSRKAATSAYASANDPSYTHPKADAIRGHIERKFGQDAANDADAHSYATHFGRGTPTPGKDSTDGGMRQHLSKNLTKAGKVPQGTQNAMKSKIKDRNIGGPKGTLPENSVKKKSHDEVGEATTTGTVGTTGTGAPANVGQAMRDPKLQQAAKNVSRMTQAAGVPAPPSQIAAGMAAQATGKMPPRQTMQTIGGLGNTIMQAAASDPRKAAQLTAMMKKMVTAGKFDEDAARSFLEQNLDEAPMSTADAAKASMYMKNPTQRPYDVNNQGQGQVQVNVPTGASANFGNKMTTNSPMSTADAAKASMYMKNPTQRAYDPKNPSYSGGGVPMPKSAAPIPTPKPTSASVVQKGGNVWNTFKSTFGRAPSQAELSQIAKSSGIKDINKVMPGQKLDFSKIK